MSWGTELWVCLLCVLCVCILFTSCVEKKSGLESLCAARQMGANRMLCLHGTRHTVAADSAVSSRQGLFVFKCVREYKENV